MHHMSVVSKVHREIPVNKDHLVLEVPLVLRLVLNEFWWTHVTRLFVRVTVVILVLEGMMVLKEIKDHLVTRDHLVKGVIR